jgi:KDO2-lipid IV(A) lauroyltransferase
MMSRAKGRMADLGFAAGWSLVKAMPGPLAKRSFAAGGHLAAVRNGPGARRLRANLRRVVGPGPTDDELDALVRAALQSYARYWLETFRLPKIDKSEVAAGLLAIGEANIDDGLARGHGVVLALPHLGNWDASGIWLVHHNGPFTTVAERLKPEAVFDRFVAYRESIGMEVVALTGGDRSATGVLTERLGQNRVVCLLADRDLSRNGIEVQFFGEATRMPGGPALLAATTGAALLPVGLWFTEDGWGQRIHPPVELPDGSLREKIVAGTQLVANAFEHDIAEHPADWHMLQRLWLSDLPPRPVDSAVTAGR